MDFDGRVVIVTGAGHGLGRSYATLLGSRGARVVINNRGAEAAEAVASEIEAAGGQAIVALGDVTQPGVPEAVVGATLDAYGRVDALINNAGSALVSKQFADTSLEEFDLMLDIHLRGPWRMTQAVWPLLVAQGYGRIVLTGSDTIFGHPTQTAYVAAKSGLTGMARCLSVSGADHDIRINTVMPTARTRLSPPRNEANAAYYDWGTENLRPERVAPLVAVLAHECCPVTGELFQAAAGHFHLAPLGLTPGIALTGGELSPETVAERFHEITDPAGFEIAHSQREAIAGFLPAT